MMILEAGAFRTTASEAARRAHLAAIVNASTDAIFSADASGRIVSANPAAQRMFGYSPQELAAMNVTCLAPPESNTVAAKCLARLTEGERLTEVEVACRRKDGSTFPALLSASPMVDAEGTVTGSSAILHDISALKQAQQDLEHLFRLSPDLISVVNNDGSFRQANPALEAAFGITTAELRSRSFRDFVHPDDLALSEAAFARLLAGGEIPGFTNRQRFSDGEYRSVEWRAKIHPVSGLIYAVGRDQTERLSLERQLNQAQKMEAVGRLAGGVAHDFNNLLTAILGFAQINIETLAAEDPRRADMEEILKAGRSATALTGQLLAFSRRQIMTPEVLDLNAVVTDVRTLLRRVIGEDVVLVTTLDERPCYVHADRGQLEQVLMNLAVNSRDAMLHGGTLTISTRAGDADIRLSVRDSGTGMPPDVLAHAFEPFYTTKATGTGLGLATVYGIVRQSGGTISVESQPGEGTCFTMALPGVSAPARPAVVQTGASLAPPASRTVLVVEDQLEVRRISRRALEAHGYRVFDAESGEAALDVLLAHPGEVDLLLTDVVMPAMSGRQLADAVTTCEPNIRVLFMSGYIDDPIIRDRVLEHGVDFIRKPFMPDELVGRVEQVLARAPVVR